MKRLSTLLPWVATTLVAAMAALNWTTLTAPAPLNLMVTQVQAPLGVVLLGVAGVLAALFFMAYLQNQIATLIETRKLLKEAQRAHDLADKAEASRLDALKTQMVAEFRRLNERLDGLDEIGKAVPGADARPPPPGAAAAEEFRPMSLTEFVRGQNH